MLKMQKVGKIYMQKIVLQDLNLEVENGRIFGLIGAVGEGKTTLCRMIAGLIPIDEGEIYIDEKPLSRHPEKYNFKPQTGRILNEYQLVYITKGSGYFSSQSCKSQKINAGTMILLFPGEWHSYYPDRETSNFDIDALISGTPSDYVWIMKYDIYDLVLSKRCLHFTSPHIVCMMLCSKKRDIDGTSNNRGDRYIVCARWNNLREDIVSFKNNSK